MACGLLPWNKRLKEQERAIGQLRHRLDTAHADFLVAEERRRALDGLLHEKDTTIAGLRSQLHKQSRELQTANVAIASQEAQLKEHDEAAASLTAQLRSLESELAASAEAHKSRENKYKAYILQLNAKLASRTADLTKEQQRTRKQDEQLATMSKVTRGPVGRDRARCWLLWPARVTCWKAVMWVTRAVPRPTLQAMQALSAILQGGTTMETQDTPQQEKPNKEKMVSAARSRLQAGHRASVSCALRMRTMCPSRTASPVWPQDKLLRTSMATLKEMCAESTARRIAQSDQAVDDQDVQLVGF
jgi:hypothetical protein